MKKLVFLSFIFAVFACSSPNSDSPTASDYPIHPVEFTQVSIGEGFWRPRIDTNRRVTIPFDFAKCEETGRIHNFAVAGDVVEGEFEGLRYNDSDVFKVIEGASYALHLSPDPALAAYLDSVITLIAAAQEDDGYLFTVRTIDPDSPKNAAPNRWENLEHDHELYNVGHMYEAAVAHYRATGKRNFLEVAIKNADLIDRVFGPGKNPGVPGHQEIEMGLVKLYRATGEDRYLKLARFFLDQRGKGEAYSQNHIPVIAQSEAVGHAVRAGYMYAGMADVAAITHDSAYVAAIDKIWQDVVTGKQYITGGVGAHRSLEGFGALYDLPNASAYNETCAAIANMFWNHRMFLLHGESKYYDILERVLYNGFLAGVSLEGDEFFYPNPLESDGQTPFNQGTATRAPWFNTACCPVNVVRFLPSLSGYVYAWQDQQVYVNLFISGTGTLSLPNQDIRIQQQTPYPWEGEIRLTVDPDQESAWALKLRIPSWAGNIPMPEGPYRYAHRDNQKVVIKVNGEVFHPELQKGYATIQRTWKPGDEVSLSLPMPIRRVVANENIVDNRGKVSLERGPIVYCAEGVDNGGTIFDKTLTPNTPFETKFSEMLGGIVVLTGTATSGGAQVPFKAIPYYAWSHRGEGEMRVWIPESSHK